MTTAPFSIRWFDRLFLASTALGVLSTLATWDDVTALEPNDPAWLEYTTIAVFIAMFGLLLVLWSLIVRNRSNAAKWILTVLTLASLPVYAMPDTWIDDGPTVWIMVEAFSVVLSIVALAGLFTPSARRWFRREPENLADTFS
jgi:peptidoglycan/LPS O-acetylase OafA/YrhL